MKIVTVNESLPGINKIIPDIDIYDPINNKCKSEIVFLSDDGMEQQSIVLASYKPELTLTSRDRMLKGTLRLPYRKAFEDLILTIQNKSTGQKLWKLYVRGC